MYIYLMKATRKQAEPDKELLAANTKRDLEYSLDIIRRTLAIMYQGPLNQASLDLSISRLESIEEKLSERLS